MASDNTLPINPDAKEGKTKLLTVCYGACTFNLARETPFFFLGKKLSSRQTKSGATPYTLTLSTHLI